MVHAHWFMIALGAQNKHPHSDIMKNVLGGVFRVLWVSYPIRTVWRYPPEIFKILHGAGLRLVGRTAVDNFGNGQTSVEVTAAHLN